MRLVILGLMRAGKDEAVNYINQKHFEKINRLKFADPLYKAQNAVYSALNMDLSTLPDGKDRTLLQLLGTEWGRKSIHPDFWVKAFDKLNENLLSNWDEHIFVTDCRFPNELECLWLHNFKFAIIYVNEDVLIQRGAKNLNHESENMVRDFTFNNKMPDWLFNNHYRLFNNGNLEDYHKQIDIMMETLKNE